RSRSLGIALSGCKVRLSQSGTNFCCLNTHVTLAAKKPIVTRRIRSARVLLAVSLLTACGGGGGSPAPPPPPPPPSTITSVSMVQIRFVVGNGGQIRFNVVVQGPGKSNTAVPWSVNNVPGGDSTNGTFSTSGVYPAPAVLPP